MGKKPKHTLKPDSKKAASSIEIPESYMSKKPSWAFSKADQNDNWSLLKDDSLVKCIKSLSKFESLTWGEILGQTHDGKSSNHYIKQLEKLHKDAKRIITDRMLDPDCLFSLRITNTTRIYGMLEETGIYYVLWYDDNHGDNDQCVYRTRKKHS